MTMKKNFSWLDDDINSTLVLKVVSKNDDEEKFYGVYNVTSVFETTGDELEVKTANIDDLTNLLTLGIVRFANVADDSDILDIPFRKLYKLYLDANVLGEASEQKVIPFKELDTFSVIDGTIQDNLLVFSVLINKIPDDLNEVMKIAYEYGNYSMQEKFDALSKITLINHRRLVAEQKENNI